MTSVDHVLEQLSVAALQRVSRGGSSRPLAAVRLAEQFTELNQAPALSLVILSRAASEAAADYRLDLALRWAAVRGVSAIGVLSVAGWIPSATASDIADRADIALVSIPAAVELTWLMQAIVREIGGGAEQALQRANQGLSAVLSADGPGFDVEDLRAVIGRALGVEVRLELADSPERDAASVPAAPDADGRRAARQLEAQERGPCAASRHPGRDQRRGQALRALRCDRLRRPCGGRAAGARCGRARRRKTARPSPACA